MAILADLTHNDPEEIVQSICRKLIQVSAHKHDLQKFINQLHVYSKLRNLEITVTKTTNQMPTNIKVTDYKLYNDGVAVGRKQGEKLANQKAEEAVLKLLLSKKFSHEEIADIQGVSVKMVGQIA